MQRVVSDLGGHLELRNEFVSSDCVCVRVLLRSALDTEYSTVSSRRMLSNESCRAGDGCSSFASFRCE